MDQDPSESSLTPRQAAFVHEYLIDLNGVQAAIRAGCPIIHLGEPAGFYVYGLLDPADGSVFYVGKGHGKRWQSHYKEPLTGSAKHARVRKASARCCVVVASGLSEAEAFTLEKQTIQALAEHLTNVSSGSEPPISRLERSKLECQQMLAEVLPFDAWMARATRTQQQIDWYHTIVKQLQEIAVHGDVEAERHRWDSETRTWKHVVKNVG